MSGHTDFISFYKSEKGAALAGVIRGALDLALRNNIQILGYGFTIPIYDGMTHLVPWRLGAQAGEHLEVLEHDWPIANASVDAVISLHGIEHAAKCMKVAHEMWRVLKPNGVLRLVIPKGGSARDIAAMLAEEGFDIQDIDAFAYAPFGKESALWEFLGNYLPLPYKFTMIKAVKRVYQGALVGKGKPAKAQKIGVPQPELSGRTR